MAYGIILKHLEVDKTIWGSFSKKKKYLRGVADSDSPFGWCGEHCLTIP
jgi:hypothetical protein